MAVWGGTKTFVETDFYNASEFTRENQNIQYLADQLTANGYPINLPFPTLILTRTDFPLVSRINHTKADINALLLGYYTPVGLPSLEINTTRLQRFDFAEANKLEINLQAIYDMFQRMLQSYRYCGTFSAGEEGLL